MMRTLALALAASALIAAPAAAGTAKVTLEGKTPQEVSRAVWAAAHRACLKREIAITVMEAHRACVVATYKSTLANSGKPNLMALADTLPAS
ncbi:hypothetical protein [Phenylobacterium sp.]|uniref:hypothetical protein n=1 Tax=Phenylobacterium sp. TaxID=1871053 RepID=UPI003D27B655